MQREFNTWLRVIPSAAGLHIAAWVARGASIDLAQVVRRAEAWGVIVRSVSHLSGDNRARAGLVIGYGAIPTAKVGEGIRRLAVSFRGRSKID
jgi:GntR family transcriptional regulator/MocR family aminotransferase